MIRRREKPRRRTVALNVIGVICDPRRQAAVRELFELFKTPWELCAPGACYDALIVSGDDDGGAAAADARLVVRFTAGPRRASAAVMRAHADELPLYAGTQSLAGPGEVRARLVDDGTPVVVAQVSDGRRELRCGYDLFDEVELLLSDGQPPEHAGIPTLDLHIELLRRWLIEADIELFELAPTPPGCGLLATLTHDVDFLGIRRHRRDRTLLGFIYRASIGSVIELLRGRRTLRQTVRNWLAVLSLPLVHAGLVEDFWLPFERYAGADAPWRSTFFVVPFRGRHGVSPSGTLEPARAVPYGAGEIAGQLRELAGRGYEIAVHGIDAWHSVEDGRAELAAVRAACPAAGSGVRMHWLYFDRESFAKLDDAGFEYDATWGYNEAVGFRAGTAQVFAPLGTRRLLELPLQIQDTALLYPGRMRCRSDQAVTLSERMIDTVRRTGGVATISWHERSLSPERLWDGVYRELLAALRARDASVRPAGEVVAWFRTRRSVRLEGVRLTAEAVSGLPSATGPDALRVRVWRRRGDCDGRGDGGAGERTDLAVAAGDLETVIADRQLVRS